MWEHGRSFPSLIAGLILCTLGSIPLLSQYGVINSPLPESLTGLLTNIALYIISAGGVYLLIDAFLEWGEKIAWVTLVLSFVVLAIGIVPLLNQFKIISFNLGPLSMTAYYIVFVLEGIFLVIAAFAMQ